MSLGQLFSIIAIVSVAFMIYHAYIRDSIFHSDTFIPEMSKFDNNAEKPGLTSPPLRPIPYAEPRTIASSGPNSPNEASKENEVVIHGSPTPSDPYYEEQQNAMDNDVLRQPERMYRPAAQNDETGIAIKSGIASQNLQDTTQNIQPFNTEFVQSGGEFMQGVYANDLTMPSSFSSF
jgi:hypothetical protein